MKESMILTPEEEQECSKFDFSKKEDRIVYVFSGYSGKLTKKVYDTLPEDWKTKKDIKLADEIFNDLMEMSRPDPAEAGMTDECNNGIQGLEDTLNAVSESEWEITGADVNCIEGFKDGIPFDIEINGEYKMRDLVTILQVELFNLKSIQA